MDGIEQGRDCAADARLEVVISLRSCMGVWIVFETNFHNIGTAFETGLLSRTLISEKYYPKQEVSNRSEPNAYKIQES